TQVAGNRPVRLHALLSRRRFPCTGVVALGATVLSTSAAVPRAGPGLSESDGSPVAVSVVVAQTQSNGTTAVIFHRVSTGLEPDYVREHSGTASLRRCPR